MSETSRSKLLNLKARQFLSADSQFVRKLTGYRPAASRSGTLKSASANSALCPADSSTSPAGQEQQPTATGGGLHYPSTSCKLGAELGSAAVTAASPDGDQYCCPQDAQQQQQQQEAEDPPSDMHSSIHHNVNIVTYEEYVQQLTATAFTGTWQQKAATKGTHANPEELAPHHALAGKLSAEYGRGQQYLQWAQSEADCAPAADVQQSTKLALPPIFRTGSPRAIARARTRSPSPTATGETDATAIVQPDVQMDQGLLCWQQLPSPDARTSRRPEVLAVQQKLLHQLHELRTQQREQDQDQEHHSHYASGTLGGLTMHALTAAHCSGAHSTVRQQQQQQQQQTGWNFSTGKTQRSLSPTVQQQQQLWSINPAQQQQLLEHQWSCLLADAMRPLPNAWVEQVGDLLGSCFHELSRQVAVNCSDRGQLLVNVWDMLQQLLVLLQEDRATVQAAVDEAVAEAAQARAAVAAHDQGTEDELVALRKLLERQAAKLAAAQAEGQNWKNKHDKLQELLTHLAAAQELVQRVLTLEHTNAELQSSKDSLLQRNAFLEQQMEICREDAAAARAAAAASDAAAAAAWEDAHGRTPRPPRGLGILAELLDTQQLHTLEQAFQSGASSLSLHRLLLGVTPHDVSYLPLLSLAGSCPVMIDGTPEQKAQVRKSVSNLLNNGNAGGLTKFMDMEHVQQLYKAVHLNTSADTILWVLDGTFGGTTVEVDGSTEATPGQQSSSAAASFGQGVKAQAHAALAGKLGAAGGGADGGGGAPVLLLPFLSLAGVLATKFGHDASELGGPVTEALIQAQLPTRLRVTHLEDNAKNMRREIVVLKRALVEQRKQEAERTALALKDQQRKIARRGARPKTTLERFLQTAWGTDFEGLGNSDDLPRILRSTGPVNNKHMSKREALRLVQDIWCAKDELESLSGQRMGLADFTAAYLSKRFFNVPRLVTEVAYNLVYSLGQHSYDADLNLFLRILMGEVEEGMRGEQAELLRELLRTLELVDTTINSQLTGWLHKTEIQTALQGFFKTKRADRLAELYEALDSDEPEEVVRYGGLFDSGKDSYQGMLTETIRSHYLVERMEFLQEIEDALRDAAEDHNSANLTQEMVKAALIKAHPVSMAEEAVMDSYIARAFGNEWKSATSKSSPSMNLNQIIKAIRRGSLHGLQLPPAATAAGAVRIISPLGKFRNQLLNVLYSSLQPGAALLGKRRSTAGGRQSQAGGVPLSPTKRSSAGHVTRPLPSADPATAAAAARGSGAGDTEEALGARPSSAGSQRDGSSIGAGEVASTPRSGANLPKPWEMDAAGPAAVSKGAATAAAAKSNLGKGKAQSAPAPQLPEASGMALARLSAMEAVRQAWLMEEQNRQTRGRAGSTTPGRLSSLSARGPQSGEEAAWDALWVAGLANAEAAGLTGAGATPGAAGAAAAHVRGVGGEAAPNSSRNTPHMSRLSSSRASRPGTVDTGGEVQVDVPNTPHAASLRQLEDLSLDAAGRESGAGSTVAWSRPTSAGEPRAVTPTGFLVPTLQLPFAEDVDEASVGPLTAPAATAGAAAGTIAADPWAGAPLTSKGGVKPILKAGVTPRPHSGRRRVQIEQTSPTEAGAGQQKADLAADSPTGRPPGADTVQLQLPGESKHGTPRVKLAEPPQATGAAAEGAGSSRSRSSAARLEGQPSHMDGGYSGAATPKAGSSRMAAPWQTQPAGAAADADAPPSPSFTAAAARIVQNMAGLNLSTAIAVASSRPVSGHATARPGSAPKLLLLTDAEDVAEPDKDAFEALDVSTTCPNTPCEGGKRNAVMMRRLHKKKSLARLEAMMLELASQASEQHSS